MDNLNLGKPIGGAAVVGHTVPMGGFDQGEHGAGTGVSGGHVPSAANQARGYGSGETGQSGFNAGLGGEHASGGLPSSGHHSHSTPIADKFMGTGSGHSHSHAPSGEAVSGAYSGGAARDALTGESNAHTTGAGVGPLAENLSGSHHTPGHSSHSGARLSSTAGSHSATHGSEAGAYGGSINRSTESGHHTGSARDSALTGTAGAAAASALGAGAVGSHGHGHSHEHSTGTGVGAVGGSGGHYSTSSTSGQHLNTGTGTGAGLLAGQQAGARGTHGDSGITSTGTHGSSAVGAGAVGAGVGAGAAGASHGHSHSSALEEPDNKRGAPISDPKDLDSGSRHGLVFDKATGKYVHRHELEEKK